VPQLLDLLRPRHGHKRLLLAALMVVAGGWLVGLVAFVASIPHGVEDGDTATDAIVVWTGGSQRLETGLRLLADGLAGKMFVSGVHPATTVADLVERGAVPPEAVACCVEAGREAADTTGNAAETAEWMQRLGFRSLRLVTSSYHMPRSLLEIRRALPDAVIVPHPVFPGHVDTEGWWRRPRTALLIAREYTKYLFAWIRPGSARPAVGS
jgi:uncharacterized SAM-binding protein YcdF (DUF218 family)